MNDLVLCYHRVSTVEPHRLAVSPKALESHLRILLRRYAPGTAADVVEGRSGVVHVTFDDAYRSIGAALPILDRLGVPATVFVCTGFADEGRPLRIPELRDDVDRTPQEFATLRWDELRELSERGVEIGSHSVDHAHLPRLGDQELERQLQDSRAEIEDELGLACRYLAYPFGEHDARVRRAAEQAGYEAAFAVDGPNRPRDRWAVRRVDLYWRDRGLRARFRLSPLVWGAAGLRPWRYGSPG